VKLLPVHTYKGLITADLILRLLKRFYRYLNYVHGSTMLVRDAHEAIRIFFCMISLSISFIPTLIMCCISYIIIYTVTCKKLHYLYIVSKKYTIG